MSIGCKCDVCGKSVIMTEESCFDYKKFSIFTDRTYYLCPKCAKIIKKDIEMLHKAYSIKRPIDRLAKILEERE